MNNVARKRRVRFSYPPAMASLAMLLLPRHQKREIAKALSLPLSTLYRWVERYGRDSVHQGKSFQAGDNRELLDLVVECEAHGFDFRKNVSCLVAADLAEPHHATKSYHIGSIQRGTRHSAVGANLCEHACARVEAARRTIDSRYYSKLSCDELAATAALSKWHFIKLFKAAHGITPYQYLTRVRVQHAKHLLDTTPYSLEAIAMTVGFDASSSLSRAFHSVEGMNLSSFFKGRKIRYLPVTSAAVSA